MGPRIPDEPARLAAAVSARLESPMSCSGCVNQVCERSHEPIIFVLIFDRAVTTLWLFRPVGICMYLRLFLSIDFRAPSFTLKLRSELMTLRRSGVRTSIFCI